MRFFFIIMFFWNACLVDAMNLSSLAAQEDNVQYTMALSDVATESSTGVGKILSDTASCVCTQSMSVIHTISSIAIKSLGAYTAVSGIAHCIFSCNRVRNFFGFKKTSAPLNLIRNVFIPSAYIATNLAIRLTGGINSPIYIPATLASSALGLSYLMQDHQDVCKDMRRKARRKEYSTLSHGRKSPFIASEAPLHGRKSPFKAVDISSHERKSPAIASK